MDIYFNVKQTLLLNAAYEPVRVVSWKKAFVLLFQEKVEVLEQYNDSVVKTVTRHYSIPAVIRLFKWVGSRRKVPTIRFSRANLYARDQYTCQYCCKIYPEKELTLDHVVPAVKGGDKSWENIVTACLSCNQRKGHKTLVEVGFKLLKEPNRPRWLPEPTTSGLRGQTTHQLWVPYLQALGFKE